MRHAARCALLALSSSFLLSCLDTINTENPDLSGQTVRLTVLHTSDIHSRLLPYDLAPLKTDVDLGLSPQAPPYGGVARLAALIRREKARADRSLLLDSGDYFQGGPIFNGNDGEPEVKWMSLMGYDGVVMGNHEFDKGVQNFADKVQRFASYPLLAANYIWENPTLANAHGLDKLSVPYTIANVRGLRVGIIGMASITSMYGLTDGGNSLQAVPLEQNEAARSYVELLRPVTDFVVILSHLGLTEDQELITGYDAYYPYESAKPFLDRKVPPQCEDPAQAEKLSPIERELCRQARQQRWTQVEPAPAAPGEPPNTFPDGSIRVFIPGVEGIDIVMGGHLHVVLNPPQVIRDSADRPVIISHPGAFAKYLGRLDLNVRVPPPAPTGVAEDGPEMQAWKVQAAWGAEVVAHDYHAFPVDGIWCDDEARSWNAEWRPTPDKTFEAISKRPKEGPAFPGKTCRERLYDALPGELVVNCLAQYDADLRDYDCDRYLPQDCLSRTERCAMQEDNLSTHLLQPYITALDSTFALPRVFAFAPRDITRRSTSTGGDSPLGNMTTESMRVRRRVEAELALTNTLGIRDNLYAGPITLESMFNIFPFENTINIMYLSGAELQELTNYVADRSAGRGCQAQAQVAGIRFVMDCAQALDNELRRGCVTDQDCQQYGVPSHPDGWRCTEEKVCWANTSFDLKINGEPLNPNGSYKIAVNDYIARGGSGFKVLKRNTTRVETGISLRDSLIDYLRGQCTCEDILGLNPTNAGRADDQKVSSVGYACARNYDGDQRIIDDVVRSWCEIAKDFESDFRAWAPAPAAQWPSFVRLDPAKAKLVPPGQRPTPPEVACNCEELFAVRKDSCVAATREMATFCAKPSLFAGRCNCEDIINGDEKVCGHITKDMKNFCSSPTRVPIAIGQEDNRIGRRVK